jgi:hypothetical protein
MTCFAQSPTQTMGPMVTARMKGTGRWRGAPTSLVPGRALTPMLQVTCFKRRESPKDRASQNHNLYRMCSKEARKP